MKIYLSPADMPHVDRIRTALERVAFTDPNFNGVAFEFLADEFTWADTDDARGIELRHEIEAAIEQVSQ